MLKKILLSFLMALQNTRARLLHTLLSVLGIVIGVAALVVVLSLIDGLEKYAHEQISSTTSLNSIMIATNTNKRVNNVWLKKENYAYFTHNDFAQLAASLSYPASGFIGNRQNAEVTIAEQGLAVGALLVGKGASSWHEAAIWHGKPFSENDIAERNPVAYVNFAFARQVLGKDSAQYILGRTIVFKEKQLKIIGVLVDDNTQTPEVYFPITILTDEELKTVPPVCMIEAKSVENVPALKTEVEAWLTNHFKSDSTDFNVGTNEARVAQAAQGFLLFRVVMGLIVGISVLVGGIGVMNVLLISVTERTVEIGVRKAMGAKKSDIMLQFLSESVTVSFLGSMLGLAMGIALSMVAVPIIKSIADVPFEAAYTWNTFIVITIVAIIIGIVFGTYPAMRAAKLDPVEAIRRE
ncbi:ABC transporter permease [Pontibacter sp. SGAir0037]|uniref:ABC transporter permease n=1 Tax=Pontibacter sp. SGAir0037 TaxID=2571030 RepID=UPI0010CCD2BC|nr:ABC transporter permease [Pontibacter sp. SGAir0037]QCR23744.1 macrolide ABC transporter permease [Pontibacter sp. SGAir0037]